MALLLLQAGMAVIPVGARLADREFVAEGLPWPDPGEADARHAVHLEGKQQPVPVDRGVFAEVVGDVETDVLPLSEADERPRNRAVDRDPAPLAALHHPRPLTDGEVDHRAGQLVEADPNGAPPLPWP